MFVKLILTLLIIFAATIVHADQQRSSQAPIVLDEELWVTFYDLPSRRFRAIRAAILTRDNESAARDLSITANYLSIESDRAVAALQAPLSDVVDQLRQKAAAVDKVTLDELDELFGRAHWLLAQHYLALARQARDTRQNRNASLYLWATTHHMERAMLWSNVAVTREAHAALEGLRKTAGELQNPETSARAYKERPVVRAETLLRKIGKQMDRRVILPPAATTGSESSAEVPDS